MADECIFCSIVVGAIPAKKVYEDAHTLGFLDINPRNPGHTLVIPKTHAQSIIDISETDLAAVVRSVKKVAANARRTLKADGISIVQNNGPVAGQVVNHLHFHVIPRFANEGPVGLEGLLPTKRMDDRTLNSVAEKMKAGGYEGGDIEEPAEQPRRVGPAPPAATRPKDEKKVTEEDFEEIDFDEE